MAYMDKAILMSAHNIRFYGEIWKIIPILSLNMSYLFLWGENFADFLNIGTLNMLKIIAAISHNFKNPKSQDWFYMNVYIQKVKAEW